MKNFISSLVLTAALAPVFVRAGGDEVVVVYNSRLPESRAVAEHYAAVRQVPAGQVYGFPLSTNEEMSRTEFRDALQQPLADKLESSKLWRFGSAASATNGQQRVVASKIRYAVLCYGVPVKIAASPDLREPAAENISPGFRRNEAAVDSELALLPLVKMSFPLTGPLPNWLYGTTNAGAFNPTNGILPVTRLDGPSAAIASGLVDKAIQAERDGLWGRTYFDARGLNPADTNYYLGDELILNAAELCRELGFETIVDKAAPTFSENFPMSQIAIYAGWYAAKADGPFAQPKVEFMPGAFAYHLHSYSAATLRSTNLNWVGPLLAKGATCTMGCVNEPYLAGTPNPGIFLARWITGSFTFGEAALAAQPFLSWQTTIIGDPLYRPFGKTPQMLHEELTRTRNPLIEWSFLRLANLNRLRGLTLAQQAGAIEGFAATDHSAVLTEKLADIYAEQGKPSSSVATDERALDLNPSPQQRIRLRLSLAEKFAAQNQQEEVYDDLRKLIFESPDYPDRFTIMKKLLDMAIASKNKEKITQSVQDMQTFIPKKTD